MKQRTKLFKNFPVLLSLFLCLFASNKKLKSNNNGDKNIKATTKYATILKGCIKVNSSWKTIPRFEFFFRGKQVTSDKEGFYTFNLENNEIPNKISIVLCKQIKQNFININTIDSLSVSTEKPCKYFSFKKTGTGQNDWKKSE